MKRSAKWSVARSTRNSTYRGEGGGRRSGRSSDTNSKQGSGEAVKAIKAHHLEVDPVAERPEGDGLRDSGHVVDREAAERGRGAQRQQPDLARLEGDEGAVPRRGQRGDDASARAHAPLAELGDLRRRRDRPRLALELRALPARRLVDAAPDARVHGRGGKEDVEARGAAEGAAEHEPLARRGQAKTRRLDDAPGNIVAEHAQRVDKRDECRPAVFPGRVYQRGDVLEHDNRDGGALGLRDSKDAKDVVDGLRPLVRKAEPEPGLAEALARKALRRGRQGER